MAEIARRLGLTHGTVRNYVTGERLPAAEILIKIVTATNVSLNWLLTGNGDKDASKIQIVEKRIDDPVINKSALNAMIREIVREEIKMQMPVQELGAVDDFELDRAIGRGDGDAEIIESWYRHEGREPPEDFLGVLAKTDEPLNAEMRKKLLIDLKNALDRIVGQ